MSSVSFKNPPAPANQAPVPANQTAASGNQPSQNQTLATTGASVPSMVTNTQLEGEFTARDMAIPYLSLGQKSGTMTDGHPEWIGKFVYDKSALLGDKIRVVVMSMKKIYEEVTEYRSDIIPQRFATAVEARESGVEFREVAQVDLLVEATNKDLADFATVTEGAVNLIPARWVVRSSSYGRVVGTLVRDLAGWLKGDLSSGFYEVTVQKQSGKGNTWFVPVMRTAGKVSPELRAEIKNRLGV